MTQVLNWVANLFFACRGLAFRRYLIGAIMLPRGVSASRRAYRFSNILSSSHLPTLNETSKRLINSSATFLAKNPRLKCSKPQQGINRQVSGLAVSPFTFRRRHPPMCRFELLGSIILIFRDISEYMQSKRSNQPVQESCYTRSSSPSRDTHLPSSVPSLPPPPQMPMHSLASHPPNDSS